MEKTKFISLLAVGLLLSNLALVAFLIYNKPKPAHEEGRPPHGGPRNIIIERLHFTDAQVAQYDDLIEWHRSEIRRSDRQIIELKNELYSALTTPISNERKDSLLSSISTLQQHIEKVHYRHFEDIKRLCTQKQQPYFEELSREIASLFAPPPHKHP